jgi:hypothetical protein
VWFFKLENTYACLEDINAAMGNFLRHVSSKKEDPETPCQFIIHIVRNNVRIYTNNMYFNPIHTEI